MESAPFDPNRVAVLLGPTASGKTGLALGLARQMPLEIVCMDSMQIYRELAIGTARPSKSETAMVPHHLFGCISVKEPMNCARYAAMASEVLAEIQSRGKWPLLVGGTGLYLKSLFSGLDPLPATPENLRNRLNKSRSRKGDNYLYKLLSRLDFDAAQKVHPNDKQRVQRFLEVRILTGSSILEHWKSLGENGGDANAGQPVLIGLQVARDLLINRIRTRTISMLAQGWIEETQRLRDLGLLARVREVGPIGYGLIEDFLKGDFSREILVEKISVQTRRYAKRQMTWFRKDSEITWFPFDEESGYNEVTISDFLGNQMT